MKAVWTLLFFCLLFTKQAFSLGSSHPSETGKIWEEQRAILASVHDCNSADLAAKQLALLEKRKPADNDSTDYDWEPMEELIRLQKAQFYGSEALAKQLMPETYLHYLLPLSPLTAEPKQQLVNRLIKDFSPYATGGPGLSQNTAWLINQENAENVLQRLNYTTIQHEYFNLPFIYHIKDKQYTVFHISVILDNKRYVVELWICEKISKQNSSNDTWHHFS